MKIFHEAAEGPKDIADVLVKAIERETGSKVFTLRILNDETKSELETLIVFEDKSILQAIINIQIVNGEMACRIRGNFIE